MASLDAFGMRLVNPRIKAGATAAIGLLLVLFFVIQGMFFIRANSPTYDEAMHLAAGYSYLATGDFRLEPQNPPLIKELLALPIFLVYGLRFNPDPKQWRAGAEFFIGQDFLYRSILPAEKILALSRLSNLLLGGSLVALTGWWAYRLWGVRAALLAMAMACLEPNLVAHSSLVTTDVGAALFIFLTTYLLWEAGQSCKWWLLTLIGISTGAALGSKFSAILLIPIIFSIVALDLWIARENQVSFPPVKYQKSLIYELLHGGAILLVMLLIVLLVISLAYFFQGFQPWLFGFQRFLTLAQVGQPAFFLGEYSYQGWWSYFVVAFFIKTPIGSLILIAASLVFYHAGTPLGRRQAVFLLVPVAIIFFATTQAKVNIGLRHVLAVYPFLFVLASRLATITLRHRSLASSLIAGSLVCTAISALRIMPHQLAYFNEFGGGPDHGYRYLGDSNLDWGQDLKGVKAYMEKENLPIIYFSYHGTAPPSHYGIRYQYVPGAWPLEWPPPADKVPADADRKILAISAYNLQDIWTPDNPLFHWLGMRQPVTKIGYSIFVFDLTHDREGLAKLEETYVKAGVRLAR